MVNLGAVVAEISKIHICSNPSDRVSRVSANAVLDLLCFSNNVSHLYSLAKEKGALGRSSGPVDAVLARATPEQEDHDHDSEMGLEDSVLIEAMWSDRSSSQRAKNNC